MIDSLVDEISYTADSASWEQSIAALEAFTGSAQSLTTGSLLITASANLNTITFTKGNGSTFDVLINTGSDATDLGPLNAFTASVAGTNAFTQSANLRLNSLEATTASLNNSVSNLNGFTQSIQTEVDNIQAVTASYATTGSNTFVGNQTIVGSVSASSFVSASRFIGDGSQITGITASVATTILNDGVLQGTATSLNFTGSGVNATVVAGVAIIQSEVDQSVLDRYTTTASFNAYTQSTDAKIDSINGFTASVAGTNTFTASIAGTNTFTASLAGTNAFTESANSRLTALENTSASVDISVSALNGFTASVAGTNAFTASIAGTNSFTASIAGTNAFTQSADQRLDSIEAQSGSWVTAAITASSLITASAAGSDITFTKGDNTQFTITVATGSVVSSSYAENAATASLARNVIVSAINVNQSTLPIGTVVRITGATGDNPQFNSASWDNDSTSANTLGILANTAVSGDYADITVVGKVVGVNTDPALGYAAGDVIYLSSSGQFTNVQPQAPLHIVTLGEVLRVQQNNGSIFVNVSNGWELNELHNVRITSAAQGDLLVYEASSSLWKNQPSSSFVKIEQTGSFATTGSNAFVGNQTISGSVTISGSATTDLTVVGQIFVSSSATGGTTAPRITVSGSAGRTVIARNSINTFNTTDEGGMFPSTIYTRDSATFDEIGFTVDPSVFSITGWSTGPAIYINDPTDTYPAVIGFQNRANYTDGRVSVLTPLSASAGFTASLTEGNIWVGNSLGQNSQLSTSSFVSSTLTGSFATTGSNTFIGNQTITGSLYLTGSNSVFRGVMDVPQFFNGELQNVIRFYQGTSGSSASSKLQFYSGSYESPNAGFVNLQSNPFNGALAISAWPANNHFVDFDIASTSSIFTAPLAGAAASPIPNTLVVRTNLTVSGSTAITLRVSSSAAGGGVASLQPLGLTFQSGSTNQIAANYGRNSLTLTDSTGAPTTIRLVGMSANPSLIGAPSVVGYTSPSIIAMNSGSQPEPVISFEHRGNYTNGQVTMVKNTRFLSGSITSGSALITGSLDVVGTTTINGNTTITGSLTLSSSLDIELNVM
jgi:hypothetical protein